MRVAAGIFFMGLVWIGWQFATAFPGERTTIIASVTPLEIHSWDEKRKLLTIIAIPDDIRVEGVFGVGVLPVSSLAKLEAMDKTKKGILARSLTDALGTPIRGGDLSPVLLLRFSLATRTIRPDAVKSIDLDHLGIYRADLLPDGTAVRVFDLKRFDGSVGSAFEIDSIRREELRVRVVNTTDLVGLGNRAARLLGRAGMVVVSVESEPGYQTQCTLHAKKDEWNTQSSRFIRSEFRCEATEEAVDDHVDLTIRLGTAFAETFQ